MPKLNLKQTPREEEEYAWRHARREGAKSRRERSSSSRHNRSHHNHRNRSASPRRSTYSTLRQNEPNRPYDIGEDFGPELNEPRKTMGDLRTEAEESHFRSKLFSAMEEDERLDAVETSFNSHVHIPHRWGSPVGCSSATKDAAANINTMTDEEYAEWIRRGMWRRTHREEIEAEERKKAEKKRRREMEHAARKVYEEEERQREMRRVKKRAEKETRSRRDAWAAYQSSWSKLQARAATALDGYGAELPPLTFSSIPWPVFMYPEAPEVLTKEAISQFLFSSDHSLDKSRKQRIRDALLAYHPDRFVGRYTSLVEPSHQKAVDEGVGRVVRALNDLQEGLSAA